MSWKKSPDVLPVEATFEPAHTPAPQFARVIREEPSVEVFAVPGPRLGSGSRRVTRSAPAAVLPGPRSNEPPLPAAQRTAEEEVPMLPVTRLPRRGLAVALVGLALGGVLILLRFQASAGSDAAALSVESHPPPARANAAALSETAVPVPLETVPSAEGMPPRSAAPAELKQALVPGVRGSHPQSSIRPRAERPASRAVATGSSAIVKPKDAADPPPPQLMRPRGDSPSPNSGSASETNSRSVSGSPGRPSSDPAPAFDRSAAPPASATARRPGSPPSSNIYQEAPF